MACAAVEEIFAFLSPQPQSLMSDAGTGAGLGATAPLASARSHAAAAYAAPRLALEAARARVSLSVAVLCDGVFVDLFASFAAPSQSSPLTQQAQTQTQERASAPALAPASCRLQRHKVSGAVFLAGAASISLGCPQDLERLLGVVLGRRAAARELLLSQPQATGKAGQGRSVASAAERTLRAWLGAGAGAGQHAAVVLTVTLVGGSIRALRSHAQFSFVAPCGDRWASPGTSSSLYALFNPLAINKIGEAHLFVCQNFHTSFFNTLRRSRPLHAGRGRVVPARQAATLTS